MVLYALCTERAVYSGRSDGEHDIVLSPCRKSSGCKLNVELEA